MREQKSPAEAGELTEAATCSAVCGGPGDTANESPGQLDRSFHGTAMIAVDVSLDSEGDHEVNDAPTWIAGSLVTEGAAVLLFGSPRKSLTAFLEADVSD